MANKALRRIQGKVRESGPLFAGLLAFRALVPDRLLGFNVFGVYTWDLSQFEAPGRVAEGIRWAEPSEAEALISVAPLPEEIHPRFDKGMRLALKEQDGAIVGWSWYDFGNHDEFDWMQYQIGSTDVWGFGAYIAHAHRGEGIFPALRSFACAELRREGHTRVISQVEALNRASTKACLRTGAKRIFQFRYLRILGITVLFGEGGIRVGRWRPGKRFELSVADWERQAAGDKE